MQDAAIGHKRPRLTLAHALFGLCVMAVVAFSLWSSLWQPSGVALIAWSLGWAIASGRVAVHWPGVGWPALSAAAMLLVWLPWTLRYGQTAWQSMYVFGDRRLPESSRSVFTSRPWLAEGQPSSSLRSRLWILRVLQ